MGEEVLERDDELRGDRGGELSAVVRRNLKMSLPFFSAPAIFFAAKGCPLYSGTVGDDGGSASLDRLRVGVDGIEGRKLAGGGGRGAEGAGFCGATLLRFRDLQ